MKRPSFDTLAGHRVLVTGAASGIGRAVALKAAAQGAELVLTDIRADDLAKVAADTGAAYSAPLDLRDHEAVQAFAADAGGPVGVVMNVAGISTWGAVERLEHHHWRNTVEVDLMGPIHVIEAFVPPMIAAGRGGQLVNVSSAAGLLGLPWHAAYSAAKFGLRGVSEVLRFDLARHGIGVTLVCPGAVATPLTETVTIAGVDADHPAIRRFRERFVTHAATPEQVADKILDGVRRNRPLVHTARDVQLGFALQRYVPPLYARAMKTMNDRFVKVAEKALLP